MGEVHDVHEAEDQRQSHGDQAVEQPHQKAAGETLNDGLGGHAPCPRASGADLTFAKCQAANSFANVKSKAPLKTIFSGGPLIPTFANMPAETGCECWNRTTSCYFIGQEASATAACG